MTNEEIYELYRSQTQWVKFSDFLENCIEFYWEEENEQEKDNISI